VLVFLDMVMVLDEFSLGGVSVIWIKPETVRGAAVVDVKNVW